MIVRVGINAAIVDSSPTGLGVYAMSMARALARRHDDIVVYASQPELLEFPADKLRLVPDATRPNRGFGGHLRRFSWTQTVLPWQLIRDGVDILYSPVPEIPLLGPTPAVMTVHDIIPLKFPQYHSRQVNYFRYLVPWELRRAIKVIAISNNTAHDVRSTYGVRDSKLVTIYNGFDADHFRPSGNAAYLREKYGVNQFILYVGNLSPHKNVSNLIKAFALISSVVPHKLVVIGNRDPRYYPTLAEEAKTNGISERIQFLDYVPYEELPGFYSQASLFVFPSLYEGFGLPPLEAMACGAPVIVSNTSSLPEVVGEAGLLVDPTRVDDLAAAMKTVLQVDQLRASMIEKGLEQSRRFSWDRAAAELLTVLKGAASQ
ncbi:MAG: glycosyltransferase family 1 protein [Bacillota bacterium]|nr:glycosyltransferase family 1 protein [Bacillota bacterium]